MRVGIAIAVLAGVAHADPEPVVDKPAAEKLFEEGRALLDGGKPSEACAKFQQVILKDPRAVGALLNLGLCNERQGKVATALGLFTEAFDRASEASDAGQRQAAEQHVAELRPQVPFAVIKYATAPLPDEKLLIDDRVVTRDTAELPVDPGIHTIVLTAPGRLPYETTFVAKVSTRIPLAMPALVVPGTTTPRAIAARFTTYGGIGLVGVSIGLGAFAYHKYHQQFDDKHCGVEPDIDGKPACDATGQAGIDSSHRWATGATIVGAVGVAAVGTGLVLWLTEHDESLHVAPTASPEHVGVSLVGRF